MTNSLKSVQTIFGTRLMLFGNDPSFIENKEAFDIQSIIENDIDEQASVEHMTSILQQLDNLARIVRIYVEHKHDFQPAYHPTNDFKPTGNPIVPNIEACTICGRTRAMQNAGGKSRE